MIFWVVLTFRLPISSLAASIQTLSGLSLDTFFIQVGLPSIVLVEPMLSVASPTNRIAYVVGASSTPLDAVSVVSLHFLDTNLGSEYALS